MTKGMRTLLVGAGKIAFGYESDPKLLATFQYPTHASVLEKHPGLIWDAVADTDQKAAANLASHYGVHAVSEPAKLIDAHTYDLAVLAVPPGARMEWLRALPNLKAILVEKPIGADLREAEEFVAHCESRSIIVQVNLIRRFCTEIQELSRTLEAEIGDVCGAFVVYGNGLKNNGTHMVDLVRHLLGEIEATSVAGRAKPSVGPLPGDIETAFTAVTTSGVVVQAMPVDFTAYRENSLDIWGTKGRILIWQEALKLTRMPRVESRTTTGAGEVALDQAVTMSTDLGSALWRAYDNLIEAIGGASQLMSPARSALSTAQVIESISTASRKAQQS